MDSPIAGTPPLPENTSICPFCGKQIPGEAVFCPHCGKQLKEAPISTAVFTQAWIYFLSIFLPPLGLWPGIKYLRHSDPKAKQIGLIAIIITVISTVVTIWATFAFLNVYLNTLNSSLYGFDTLLHFAYSPFGSGGIFPS